MLTTQAGDRPGILPNEALRGITGARFSERRALGEAVPIIASRLSTMIIVVLARRFDRPASVVPTSRSGPASDGQRRGEVIRPGVVV
jgi:hypothetical protein